jgi:hypothetical protein
MDTTYLMRCPECRGKGCKCCNSRGYVRVKILPPSKQRKPDWGRLYG